jgi:hypothetical protein
MNGQARRLSLVAVTADKHASTDGACCLSSVAMAQLPVPRSDGQPDDEIVDVTVSLGLRGRTFGDLLDAWLDHASQRCGTAERAALRSVCKRIRAALGDRQRGDVDDAALRAYLRGLVVAGLAARTVLNHGRVLSRVCSLGRRAGVVGPEVGRNLGLDTLALGSHRGEQSPPMAQACSARTRAATGRRLPKRGQVGALGQPKPQTQEPKVQQVVLGSQTQGEPDLPKAVERLDPSRTTWQAFRLGERYCF